MKDHTPSPVRMFRAEPDLPMLVIPVSVRPAASARPEPRPSDLRAA